MYFFLDEKVPKNQGCGTLLMTHAQLILNEFVIASQFCYKLFNLPKLHKLAPFSRSNSAQFLTVACLIC
jgi:hypothetical protein